MGEKLITGLKLVGSERIFDLGCGDGKIIAELAALVSGDSVVGIDSSRGMLLVAERDLVADNLIFRFLDIASIEYKAEFEVISF